MNPKILAVILAVIAVSGIGAYLFYGPARATLSIMDPPPQPYDSSITAITIHFTSIDIHTAGAGNESGWHTLTTDATVNLLSVLDVAQVLGTSNIPAGKYSEIRFFASEAIITINGANVTYSIPSASQTGFKVIITGGGFQVVGGQTIDVKLDLAFRNSEILNNPQLTLTPVATATIS